MGTKLKTVKQNLFSPQAWSYDAGILFLRLACGLMLLHGWSKLTNFSEGIKDWPDPFHIGMTLSYTLTVFAEVVCTLLLVLGLFTRVALIPLIVLMLVIVFSIHSGEPFSDREHGLLYLIAYISLLFSGPGKYSLDRFILKK